jgi:hypothetical protein
MNKRLARRSFKLAALALWGAATLAQAQTATIYGSLGNFDVVNNTGEDACGFQIEIEGVPYGHPIGTFNVQRYGPATVEDYTSASGKSGRRVTHKSSDCSTNKTVPHPLGTPFGGTCYQWNTNTYDRSGCEHFGVHYFFPTSTVTYRWLVRDPVTVGAYVPRDPPIQIASPVYYVQPPVLAGDAPVVVAVIPAPPAPPARFGEPHWMKTYVRQLPRQVTLEELITENPLVVPMAAAQLETDWELIQADPPGEGGRRGRGRSQKGSTLDPTTRTVVRRFETFAYTGPRDALTNEALCADLLCKVPSPGELGEFVSAQMAAVHVQGDFVSAAKAGSGGGNVDSADRRISCGNKCVAPYAAGSMTTLTAKANSGSTFAGWSGACTGTAATCSVTVIGAKTATATFNTATGGGSGGGGTVGGGGGGTATGPFALAVSLGNPGTVTSSTGGINCGSVCSASYAANTVVTLTATPLPGLAFTGWSGACSATVGPVCSVTMSKALSVKANFTK